MTRHRPHEGTTGVGKSRTLAWLIAIGLACSLEALAAPSPQQAPAQGGNQPANSQDKATPDKAGADKAKADKAKQDAAAAKPPGPSSSRSAYSVTNGTYSYSRTEESAHTPTKDGSVDTQSVRMPSWNGDNRVLVQQEVHTKNLPDGTVEKETITKNTDGADRLEPIEIVRERVKKVGDKTTIERDTLTSDGEGHWNTIRKEQVNETGTDKDRKTVKELMQPDVQGRWQVVDRETTTSKAGKDTQESHTVREIPDAHGQLSDYEVKDDRTTVDKGKEIHQETLSRRDFKDTDHPEMRLIDKTTEVKTTSADGKQVATHTTTESSLLDNGATPDLSANHPEVVKETTEVDTKGPNGDKKTLDVKERTPGDPNGVHPTYKVVTDKDKDGHVRQVFIPSN